MADRLRKVRTQLVERLSAPVLKQILDGLLDEEVLNDGEIDGILQGNKTRADQTRNLVDVVKNKGDTASERMLTLLESKDRILYLSLDFGPQ